MSGLFSKLFGKNKTEDEEYYIKNPDPRPLSDEQLFGISLGLIINELNGAYVDSLETSPTDYPQKQQMQRNWNIRNREDALSFMSARSEKLGHRQIFNALLEIYIAQECNDAEKIDFTATKFEDNWEDVVAYLENLDEVLEVDDYWFTEMEDDLQIGTDAWDIGRVVFVARVCYSLGYITETEAWQYINKMSEMARSKFDNWEDYAKSYMLGRAMWAGDDGDGWSDNSAIAIDGLDNKQSPWLKLKW